MKKIFILIIIALTYVFFISYADYGTSVEYLGNGTEEYTVTVPAKMNPNGSGEVIVEGEWASNRVVNVTADEEVELVNTINVFNKKTLEVNFIGINANGDDLERKKVEETILVSDLDSQVLFGEWKGTFDYSVEIVDDPYDELYYGRIYTGTVGSINASFVFYKDKSFIKMFEGFGNFKTEPDSFYFENNRGYMKESGDYFDVSEDKTILTLYDFETDKLVSTMSLLQSENVVDNTLPITLSVDETANNTSVTLDEEFKYVKFSDVYLTEQQLLKTVSVTRVDGEIVSIFKNGVVNCIDESACSVNYGNDYSMFVSVRQPFLIENLFFPEPGLYYPDYGSSSGVEFEIYLDDEFENIEWNTLDVKNNKKVDFNGHELVKVSDEVKDSDFFEDNAMSFTINGHIMNFENYYSVDSSDIYKVEYKGGFKYVIVVNEPGEYEGVTFDEVGVYAYNFGKHGLNYDICLGKKYSPDFKSTLKYGKYIYNDDYYFTFDEDLMFGYSYLVYSNGYESRSGSSYFGRSIYIDDKFGIVSRDGTYIKLYKYLSDNWSFDEDIVTLTYQEE